MWLDNASDIDILFYTPYAKLIDEIVKTKDYNPLTIGLFGLWGAGKSTLLELIKNELDTKKNNIACVQLNAWMFEGYEDAKIALIESLLNAIKEEKSKFKNIEEKIIDLLKSVDYFKLGRRAITKGIPIAASIISGNPLPLMLNIPSNLNDEQVEKFLNNTIKSVTDFKNEYVKNQDETPVENIRVFSKKFEDALKSSGVDNLIVLVDDLDRCTPDRIIETLEAIKLFLSVKRTTFIIAADETVIKYAIKRKFPPIDGSSVEISKEYIEKIIQLPITIPELSTKDIENYLLLLIAELYLKEDDFKKLIKKFFEEEVIIKPNPIKLEDFNKLIKDEGLLFKTEDDKAKYREESQVINNIKRIVATTLKGNPRQAKRFLNTFMVKRKLANMYFKDGIDVKILAKMLVLQKINSNLFRQLNDWNKDFDTENVKFKNIYELVINKTNDIPNELAPWGTSNMISWMNVEPKELYKCRLDKYFYLSREYLENNVLEEGLSNKAKDILEKIGGSSEATIDQVISLLSNSNAEVIDEVMHVLLEKMKSCDLEWYIIKSLFVSFEAYRIEIMKIINSMPESNLKIQCIPYLKTMLRCSKDIVIEHLSSMKDKNLDVKIYNNIVKEKRRN